MNYKGIKFENSINEFKRWNAHFPPVKKGKNVKYLNVGNYYASFEIVEGFLLENSKFIGETYRKYDKMDFENLEEEEKKEVKKIFEKELIKYKKRYLR